jgi:hypothetical protein
MGMLPNCYLGVWKNDGSGSFTPFSALRVGCSQGAFAVAVADWDKDGDVDAMLKTDAGITPFLGDGTGQFETLDYYSRGGGGDAVFADLDGDGFPELLNVNANWEQAYFDVYRNNRDGTFGVFSPQFNYRVPNLSFPAPYRANPVTIRAADLDGDGRLDLVADAFDANALLIYRGTGALQFSTTPTVLPVLDAGGVEPTDVDQDGDLDLVTIAQEYGLLATLKNDGGSFGAPIYSPTGLIPGSLRIADLNGDCFPDALATSFENSYVSVSLNRNGSFEPAVNYSGAMLLYAIATGDIDGDQDIDLVMGNKISYTYYDTIEGFMSVIRNLGDGTFFAPRAYDAIPNLETLAIGEFNGDGINDLTFGKTVLLSSPDGRLDTYVQADGEPFAPCGLDCGVAAPDLNGDGLSDLIENGEDGPHSAYVSNGDGTFTRTWWRPASANSLILAIGNLNHDDFVDFVDVESWAYHQVFLADTATTFLEPLRIDLDWNGYSVGPPHLGDLNDDGLDEILIPDWNYRTGGLAVQLNLGDGTSYAQTLYTIPGGAWGIDTADYDGDGDVDVSVAICGEEYGWVAILRGNGTGALGSPEMNVSGRCPMFLDSGDFDADGDIDIIAASRGVPVWETNLLENPGNGVFPSFRSLVSGWNPQQVIADDFDRDGDLDIVQANGASYTATIFENRVLTEDPSQSTPAICDRCPTDPAKVEPGQCGCGLPDADTDRDTVLDCRDGCPQDALKTQPGRCGCGVSDADGDGDGTPNCSDDCPSDASKVTPALCGCGVSEVDSDRDGAPNCADECPQDNSKTSPGVCGCGALDADTDSDSALDCNDPCPRDPEKTLPGLCGCGIRDVDGDADGTPDCTDGCPADPQKLAPGACGCDALDTDSDADGAADCNDACAEDPAKTAEGACGCGTPDADRDGDLTADCIDGCPDDPSKIEPLVCGCSQPETDANGTGQPDCNDDCASGDAGCPDGGGGSTGEAGAGGDAGASDSAGAGGSSTGGSTGNAAGADNGKDAGAGSGSSPRNRRRASSDESSGCGCSLPGSSKTPLPWTMSAAIFVAIALRRRRNRRRSQTSASLRAERA